MITGFFLDRILNQVQLAPWIKRNYGTDLLTDPDYKQRWCQSNLDIFLHGISAYAQPVGADHDVDGPSVAV